MVDLSLHSFPQTATGFKDYSKARLEKPVPFADGDAKKIETHFHVTKLEVYQLRDDLLVRSAETTEKVARNRDVKNQRESAGTPAGSKITGVGNMRFQHEVSEWKPLGPNGEKPLLDVRCLTSAQVKKVKEALDSIKGAPSVWKNEIDGVLPSELPGKVTAEYWGKKPEDTGDSMASGAAMQVCMWLKDKEDLGRVKMKLEDRLGRKFNVKIGDHNNGVINVFSAKIDKMSLLEEAAQKFHFKVADALMFAKDIGPDGGNDNYFDKANPNAFHCADSKVLCSSYDQWRKDHKGDPTTLVVSSGLITTNDPNGKKIIDPEVARRVADWVKDGGKLFFLTGRGQDTGPGMFKQLIDAAKIPQEAAGKLFCGIGNGGVLLGGEVFFKT
ncbi:MAG: hypothetical protein A2289_13810 [Deltaproteobacteria bacterium RIFOXYA12_FULL_58_15]|nr:MAG: hypothetical protein A2289_13810 [Deltaproteobacteria bacterium RIFOXYA12_FULL_58_15]